jgi:GNAT superfamily N-acetyltransferase
MPMATSYRILPARPADVRRLAAVELAAARLLAGHAPPSVLGETTAVQDLARAQAEGRLWVALADDQPVGFAHVELIEPAAAHLQEIDVHPDHGRRGLGRRLVTTVCEWARDVGRRSVTLTSFRDVPWNMPFYARLGFEEIPAGDLSPALASVLRDEARRGLDPTRRVAMRRRLDLRDTTLRVARPTDRLEEVVRFYANGLGLEVLGSFRDHDGFDGVMLGRPGAAYHLEFTRQRGHRVGRAPTRDHLLVFYLPDPGRWRLAVERMRAAGYEPVPSFNPYWDRQGRTFEDPDGYRVVLQNAPAD